jgi:hypothetical protein
VKGFFRGRGRRRRSLVGSPAIGRIRRPAPGADDDSDVKSKIETATLVLR